MKRTLLILITCAAATRAADYYTYIGDLSSDSALICWGTTAGRGKVNTIGRDSHPLGAAVIRIGEIELTERNRNWVVVTGLVPDTQYQYEVRLGSKRIGDGVLRTWPAASQKLAFFVIGDFGTGNRGQYRVAEAMWREFDKRRHSDNPIRFVLTTGDNIYGDGLSNGRNTGDEDRDWESKFFRPYARINASIPWYPTLGNHDGNETEAPGDLPTYLDNFFFPAGKPARYYSFSYGGGLADFFALDSTQNSGAGRISPAFYEVGPQFAWMVRMFAASRAKWKIPYFHHPLFGAGPNHEPSIGELRHFIDLFAATGVRVVFNGHEHNFQYSKNNERSGHIRFVITGAGGELASREIRRHMDSENIEGWAGQRHFCIVEIDGDEMTIIPTSYAPVTVVDDSGKPVSMPLSVRAQ